MNCPNGHGKMREKKLAEYEAAPILGMRSVVVKDLPAFVCPACGETIIAGEVLDKVHTNLLVLVLTSDYVLSGEEVRFIRKALRLSQSEFADRLGVHRTTVTRWETGEVPVEAPVSIAIRALAAVPRVGSLNADQRKAVVSSFERPPLVGKHDVYNVGVA